VIGFPTLETERLVLRGPDARDWEAWAAFLASDRARYAGGPKDRPDAWRALGHMIGHWTLRGFGLFVFALKDSDVALGSAGPYYPEGWPEHEIGWTIWHADAEGRGYAFEAARAARAWAYRTLGWTTAVSYIHPDNARSIALAHRLGATADPGAARPHPGDLVYRHPAPEARP
jgi:RimJ/RimL family protein N-acetyltransferase